MDYVTTVGIKKREHNNLITLQKTTINYSAYYTRTTQNYNATTQNYRPYYRKLHYTTDKTTCTRNTHKLSKLHSKSIQ